MALEPLLALLASQREREEKEERLVVARVLKSSEKEPVVETGEREKASLGFWCVIDTLPSK